jgi:hypothetical protein
LYQDENPVKNPLITPCRIFFISLAIATAMLPLLLHPLPSLAGSFEGAASFNNGSKFY